MLFLPWSANNEASGTDFWDFIRLVDQGLLPSESGRTLQVKTHTQTPVNTDH